ncbi:MAG: hypoxanthine phosphoribosyltransferase [Bacillota bacterium]|jgi:hypoxanthine phosphoribosyltransferase|nr:hypoxanthine phosphoribosyltransferase [Candidatus Fermentithermobacillaceae bacterium]
MAESREKVSVLISQAELEKRIKELAQEINRDYEGKDLLLIGVLKGSFMFLADLLRYLDPKTAVDFMGTSSYGASTQSSGEVRITKDLEHSPAGRHVLLVEDIVDTGLTLRYLVDTLRARQPASLKICALLDKPARRRVRIGLDYYGFIIPNAFVVGYGLDYQERYRGLPYVGVLEETGEAESTAGRKDASGSKE